MCLCTCVRGPTLARLATVSIWKSCGKPSTKFPHGGLVECVFQKNTLQTKILSFRDVTRKAGTSSFEEWQSCGKPSTKFPHGGIVECALFKKTFSLKIKKSRKTENLVFS